MKGYAAALAERPDVILCDLVMPDGDGLYVFRRLLDHTLTADIPFLVLTGQTNPAVRREVLSSGAAGYLFKPLNFDELLSHLARFIRIARTPPSAVRPHAADRRLVFREPWSDGVADDFRRSAPGEKPIPV